jgi:TusA-related sulfurtransferase
MKDKTAPHGTTQHTRELDLRGLKCPLTFVHLRLALEEMKPGEDLRIFLDDKLASVDVPRNAELEGHTVLSMQETRTGLWELWLKKKN